MLGHASYLYFRLFFYPQLLKLPTVSCIFNSFQLANENKILAQRDIQLLLNVVQKGVPKEIAKTIMNIVARCSEVKLHFLNNIDEQCKELCIRKGSISALLAKNCTPEYLQHFNWDIVLTEIKERLPDLLDVLTTVAIPKLRDAEKSQITTVCSVYGMLMNKRWHELSLLPKMVSLILGVGHATKKVCICMTISF